MTPTDTAPAAPAAKSGFTHESTINESFEWYTPPVIFEAMGLEFDLDPCSPGAGLSFVPAKKHYTIDDDGLTSPWSAHVWLKPHDDEKELQACHCDCHQATPSSALNASRTFREIPIISVNAPIDHSGYLHVAGSAFDGMTDSATIENPSRIVPNGTPMDCKSAHAVTSISQPRLSSSADTEKPPMVSTHGAKDAPASIPSADRSVVDATPSKNYASMQKRSVTPSQSKGEPQSEFEARSTISFGSNEPEISPGTGLYGSGTLACEPGATDVRTVESTEHSHKTTSFQSQTQIVPEQSPGTSFPPASHATPPSTRNVPRTGALTGADCVQRRRTSKVCGQCDNDKIGEYPLLVFVNPPYGAHTPVWMRKLADHGDGIALVFARTDVRWFQDVAESADLICFVSGRIKFYKGDIVNQGGTPGAGSMLVAWGKRSADALRQSGLGVCFAPVKR
jgi:hypothetical protein